MDNNKLVRIFVPELQDSFVDEDSLISIYNYYHNTITISLKTLNKFKLLIGNH